MRFTAHATNRPDVELNIDAAELTDLARNGLLLDATALPEDLPEQPKAMTIEAAEELVTEATAAELESAGAAFTPADTQTPGDQPGTDSAPADDHQE